MGFQAELNVFQHISTTYFRRPLYHLFVCSTPEMEIHEGAIHGKYELVQVQVA